MKFVTVVLLIVLSAVAPTSPAWPRTLTSNEFEIAAEDTPSVFKEERCFGGFKFPPKPGKMDPAEICLANPELCPPTGPPPPSCMCNPPRPGALLGGQHVGDLGVSFDNVHTFAGRQNWGNLDGSNAGSQIPYAVGIKRSSPCLTTIISYPGVPNIGSMESCAAGAYQAYYVRYGERLKAAGLTDSKLILRIGWEWDIHTNPSMSVNKDISKAPTYARCFRNIVQGIRQGCEGCSTLFDWNSSGGISEALFRAGYPGRDVVDIISVEGYDNIGPRSGPAEARWAAREAKLRMVRDFAIANGKYTAIPEWGVWNCSIGGCGATENGFADNPYYIQKLCEWSKNPANKAYYTNYFGGSDVYPKHNLSSPANALSRAAFTRYCGCAAPE